MCVTLIMEREEKKSVHLQQFSEDELLFSFFFFSQPLQVCFLTI